jgi:hypothetical protein
MSDLNQFREWVKAKPERAVKIDLGEPGDNTYEKIWVFDYSLMAGQHVSNIDEIDLEKVKQEGDLAQLEALKAKYEQTA